MGYEEEPDYEGLKNLFKNIMSKNGYVDDRHFDWFNLKDKNGNSPYPLNKNISNQPVFNSTLQAVCSNTFRNNKDNLNTEERFPNTNNMGAILETNALNNKEIDNMKYMDTQNNFNTNGDKLNNKSQNYTNTISKDEKNKKVLKENTKNPMPPQNKGDLHEIAKINQTDLNQSNLDNKKKDKSNKCCIL